MVVEAFPFSLQLMQDIMLMLSNLSNKNTDRIKIGENQSIALNPIYCSFYCLQQQNLWSFKILQKSVLQYLCQTVMACLANSRNITFQLDGVDGNCSTTYLEATRWREKQLMIYSIEICMVTKREFIHELCDKFMCFRCIVIAFPTIYRPCHLGVSGAVIQIYLEETRLGKDGAKL